MMFYNYRLVSTYTYNYTIGIPEHVTFHSTLKMFNAPRKLRTENISKFENLKIYK